MDTSVLSWGHMQALLIPQRSIPAQVKSSGAVEFWRQWDDTRQCAVWTKTYRSAGGHQLDAFNQAELEILMQLAQHKVPNTYRPALIQRAGTPLATAHSGGNASALYTLKTDDAGPTLDDWLCAPLAMQNGTSTQAHCLVHPENFLQLAQTLLSVLEGVHANNYVHCDVHAGNIALPVRLLKQDANAMAVELLWNQLTLIDFGYSINLRSPPRTTLPFKREGAGMRISQHLASKLIDIERQTLLSLTGSERWEDVWLNPAFWQRWQGPSPLDQLKDLDWREDLYQLGCLLADIRDGVGMASHLEGRTVQESPVAAVNHVIDQLPEQLKTWGQGIGSAAPPRPHRTYINAIGEALAAARQHGRLPHSSYQLRQTDYPTTAKPLAPTPAMPAPAPTGKSLPFMPARKPSGIELPALQVLPAGSFTMGSRYSKACEPVHRVDIRPPQGLALAVGRHAISCAQWAQARHHNSQLYLPPQADSSEPLDTDSPMVNISWFDCQAYLDTLNHLADLHRQPAELRFRLLSEAEWEYAARAGIAEPASPPSRASASVNAGVMQPVHAGPANPWGLFGMEGNAWEWLADHHHPDYNHAPADGSAWCSSTAAAMPWHQVRGGSWATPAEPCGLAMRASHPANWRSPFVAMRIARWVPQDQSINRFPDL